MSQHIIDLFNITKSYGDTEVIKDLTLYIRKNEFITLLGPSGCGKTTTLRIISGFEKPDSGRVLFDNVDITDLPPHKRKVNTVFQKYSLFPHMNVYENIVALRTKLDKANVPVSGRFVVVPPEVYALLLLDDRFVKASDSATANAALLNGEVGRVAGFTVYMSNNTPYASETWSIPAGVKTATTYAEQIVSTEAYRLEKRFADAVKGLHVYGAKVTDGTQLAVLKAKVANP